MLARNPGFTSVVVLTLAIGVGANIAIFGFVNALLLKPLDVEQPDRLIRAYGAPSEPIAFVAYDDYREYRDRTQSLSNLAIFHWGGLQPVRVDGPLRWSMSCRSAGITLRHSVSGPHSAGSSTMAMIIKGLSASSC
jgi:hypothetical protein